MLNALLFDADDTLYEEKHAKVVAETAVAREIAKIAGLDLLGAHSKYMETKYRVLRELKGDPRRNDRLVWMETLLSDLDLPQGDAPRLRDLFWDHAIPEIRPYADAAEVLPLLAERYPLYILTNEDLHYAERKLEHTGLITHFQDIISAFEVEQEKPSKEYFDIALKRIGITPEETIMIGNDPRSDIQGANAYGIDSVLLRRGPFASYICTTPEETPTHDIGDFFELQELLLNT